MSQSDNPRHYPPARSECYVGETTSHDKGPSLPESDDHNADLKALAQDMVATLEHRPGYKLAITDKRIILIAKEMLRLTESVPSASRFPTLPCIPMMNAVIHAGGFGASPAQDEYVWKKMIEAAPKETPPEGAFVSAIGVTKQAEEALSLSIHWLDSLGGEIHGEQRDRFDQMQQANRDTLALIRRADANAPRVPYDQLKDGAYYWWKGGPNYPVQPVHVHPTERLKIIGTHFNAWDCQLFGDFFGPIEPPQGPFTDSQNLPTGPGSRNS